MAVELLLSCRPCNRWKTRCAAPNLSGGDGPAAHPRRLVFRACALVLGYSPHTLLATFWMRAILAHCSSSVSLLPISQLAKPHWGDR